MPNLAAVLFLLLVTIACGNDGTRPAPSSIPPPAVPQIDVGEVVEDALTGHGSARLFELTAPSDGTLVVQLSWNHNQGFLELWVNDEQFMGPSPIVRTLRVAAGSTHRIKIVDGAPWDYDDLDVRFVLATSLETPAPPGSPG